MQTQNRSVQTRLYVYAAIINLTGKKQQRNVTTDPLQLGIGVRVTLGQEPLSDLLQLLLLTLPVSLVQLRLLLSVANPLL